MPRREAYRKLYNRDRHPLNTGVVGRVPLLEVCILARERHTREGLTSPHSASLQTMR